MYKVFRQSDIKRKRQLKVFILIELLVVIAIIAILAALLLPALQKARETAHYSVCKSQIKQIGLITMNYAEDYNGYIPAIRVGGDFQPLATDSNYWTYIQGYYYGFDRSKWHKMLNFPTGDKVKVKGIWRCPKSNIQDLNDARRTSYHVAGYVWGYINDRNLRFGGGTPPESEKYCLNMYIDIKKPAITAYCGDGYGQGKAMYAPTSTVVTQIPNDTYRDAGNLMWGPSDDGIVLRHMGKRSYNMLFFDMHVEGWKYSNYPESLKYLWCLNN